MKNTFLAFSILVALTACSSDKKDEKIADADGNCTAETVENYNAVVYAQRDQSYSQSEASLQKMVNACEKLESLMGGVGCKAVNVAHGDEMTLAYSRVEAQCASAKSTLQNPIEGINFDGTCKQVAIDAYNTISKSKVPESEDLDGAKQTLASCEALSRMLAGKTCSAKYGYSQKQNVSIYDLGAHCDKAKEVVNFYTDDLAAGVDRRPISEIKSLQIIVKNPVEIQKIISGDEINNEFAISKGKVESTKKTEAIVCSIKDEKREVRRDDKIELTLNLSITKRGSINYVSIFSEDRNTSLYCRHKNGKGPWIMQDIKDAFGDTADISAQ
jgi:hypothetical protein